ncbi:hypothetical protein B0H19DRAFT_1072368 [Mycena capillaripes]|nr:hypothetical protein B0H19DRAFT_1072368 [Mycena capillaripes]
MDGRSEREEQERAPNYIYDAHTISPLTKQARAKGVGRSRLKKRRKKKAKGMETYKYVKETGRQRNKRAQDNRLVQRTPDADTSTSLSYASLAPASHIKGSASKARRTGERKKPPPYEESARQDSSRRTQLYSQRLGRHYFPLIFLTRVVAPAELASLVLVVLRAVDVGVRGENADAFAVLTLVPEDEVEIYGAEEGERGELDNLDVDPGEVESLDVEVNGEVDKDVEEADEDMEGAGREREVYARNAAGIRDFAVATGSHPVAPEACGAGGTSNDVYHTQDEPPDATGGCGATRHRMPREPPGGYRWLPQNVEVDVDVVGLDIIGAVAIDVVAGALGDTRRPDMLAVLLVLPLVLRIYSLFAKRRNERGVMSVCLTSLVPVNLCVESGQKSLRKAQKEKITKKHDKGKRVIGASGNAVTP